MIKKYSAFTLVEMLIVMGILVILMTMGIAAGRFAIQQANKVQHQNAVDDLYTILQSYYAENREYPGSTDFVDWPTAMGTGGVLSKYSDTGAFEGGSDATYYYSVDTTGQSVLVCTSFGGYDDDQGIGGYCNGNGFGVLPTAGTTKVTSKALDESQFATIVVANSGGGAGAFIASDWSGSDKDWQ